MEVFSRMTRLALLMRNKPIICGYVRHVSLKNTVQAAPLVRWHMKWKCVATRMLTNVGGKLRGSVTELTYCGPESAI